MNKFAVVVDPMSTGRDYPAVFAAEGVEVVAVLSTSDIPEFFAGTWLPENFRHIHVYDGDLDALADTVRGYHPLCVIPGSECGVELADALVEKVLPGTGNVPELAPARRHKWSMAQAVRDAGVPHIRQLCSADPAEIQRWLHDTGLHGRKLVIKPPTSCATDEVHMVMPGADWRPLVERIIGKRNFVGLVNDSVLVQEFAEGRELMVDSYSVDGRHGLVDICRYTKGQRGDRIGIYDLVDFAGPNDEDIPELWAYVRRVLDAVGIRNGCAHTEVIHTADGPRLVEVGARPAGGGHQMISELATGSNHLIRTVQHQVHGRFWPTYELRQYVCSVVLMAPHAGIWRNADLFDRVDELETFHMKHFYFRSGERVPEPSSLGSMIGWVVLATKDRAAMEADYHRIKELEKHIDVAATAAV